VPIPGSGHVDYGIPIFMGGTAKYPRVNAFQCKVSEQSDLDELARRRSGYTFTGLLPNHGYLAGPKAGEKDYVDRARRSPEWIPPRARPLYLMHVDGADDIELGITACDLPNQFSISFSAAKGMYLLRPLLKSDIELLPGCHPYYAEGAIQVFWLDPRGTLERELIVLPTLTMERNFRHFRLFWTKKGWLADDDDRILLRSGDTWIPIYVNPKNGHAYYRATSVSPDGCLVGIQVSDFEPTGYERVRWFSKQFRVLDLCQGSAA